MYNNVFNPWMSREKKWDVNFSYEHKKICKVNNLFFFFYFCPLFSRLFIYVFCLFFIRNRDLNNKRKKSLIILQFVLFLFVKLVTVIQLDHLVRSVTNKEVIVSVRQMLLVDSVNVVHQELLDLDQMDVRLVIVTALELRIMNVIW